MAWVKLRARSSMSWAESLLSANSPSAMWALSSVPGLMTGNLSASSPAWRIYLSSDEPAPWPEQPLQGLLSQSFASRAQAARALEDFAALYPPTLSDR